MRDISHTELILSSSIKSCYTEHQLRTRKKLRCEFGNVKRDKLVLRLKLLTQELKATLSKVSYHKKKVQRDGMNRLFAKNRTLFYCYF